MSLNHVTVMGRITADPELRRTQSGTAVTSFSLAVERDGKGPNGEKQTDFFEIVAWSGTAELVCKYITKGRQIAIDGRLQTRGYTDRDGNKRKVVEIVASSVYFADSKREEAPTGGYSPGGSSYGGYSGGSNDFAEIGEEDGELPF